MAECKVTTVKKYVLYLSAEEASFIKLFCQNSIQDILEMQKHNGEPLIEDSKTKALRHNIRMAIDSAEQRI